MGDWATVGSTTYLTIPDTTSTDGYIVDPDNQIDSSTRQVFGRGFVPAARVVLRMQYKPVSELPVGVPVVKLFGRTRYPGGTAGPWRILCNLIGDTSATFTATLADQINGIGPTAAAWTTPDDATTFDVAGCNEFLVGVEFACSADSAALEVRFH